MAGGGGQAGQRPFLLKKVERKPQNEMICKSVKGFYRQERVSKVWARDIFSVHAERQVLKIIFKLIDLREEEKARNISDERQ